MDTVFSAIFPIAERSRETGLERSREKSQEIIKIECRQHWGILIVPGLFLAAWLAMGLLFASIIANTFSIFGQEQLTFAPQIIPAMFVGSALLIGLLYWHSYRRSSIRLTTQRAVLKTGPLFRGAGEIELDRAKLVALRQPVLGRLLDYGTVSIVGAGRNRFRLRFIPNAREFYERLNSLLSR